MSPRVTSYDPAAIRAWVASDGGTAIAAKAAALDLDQLDLDELRGRIDALTCARSALRFWGDQRHEHALLAQQDRLTAAAAARKRSPCSCGLADEARCERKMTRRRMATGYAIYPYCQRRGDFCGGAVKKAPGWEDLPEVVMSWAESKCAACEALGPTESHHVAPRERFGVIEAERWPRVDVCRLCHMHWHEWEHGHEAQAFPADEAEGGLCEICNDFAKVVHRPWFEGIGKAGSFVRSWVCRKCWDGYEAKMHGYVWRARGLAGGTP